jgi:hypothetical protein
MSLEIRNLGRDGKATAFGRNWSASFEMPQAPIFTGQQRMPQLLPLYNAALSIGYLNYEEETAT